MEWEEEADMTRALKRRASASAESYEKEKR